VLPSREWKQRVHKKPWYQGDTISVGIGQGYWIATHPDGEGAHHPAEQW
jgi:penicillin-binding protein 2